MNSSRWLVLVAALCGLAVWGCCGLTRHVIVAVDHFGDAGAAFAQTAAAINRPKSGTIAMINEDVGAAKSAIIHADLVARHEQQQLSTWDQRGTILFNNINGGVTDLRATINAATRTANAGTDLTVEATRTLKAVNDPSTGLAPVLIDTDAVARDLHAIAPDVERTAAATASTMEQTSGVMGDGHKVADHYERIIDNPKASPWYLRMLPDMPRVALQAAIDWFTARK